MSLALPITFMKFQRGFEGEADYLGLQYMYKAGYDPQAFIDVLREGQGAGEREAGDRCRRRSPPIRRRPTAS